MTTVRDYLKNKKVVVSAVSLTTLLGFVAYQAYSIKRRFSSLVDTNVLDYDKKRPDYIYIHYSIYRESMKRKQQKEEEKTLINIIIHPFGKWWKSMKHSLAWRLLKMAQTGDQHDRIKAVKQLTLIKHLKDWDFQHLAQLCDERTAISLARSECDQRWFLPPKMNGTVMNPKILLKDIHTLLDDIKSHQCAATLLKKTFKRYQFKSADNEKIFLHYGSILPKQELELLKQCVDVLFHLTEFEDVSEKIITQGGLVQIMELYKIFRNDLDIKLKLCKIIANMSICNDKSYDFFVTGWINVLSNWSKDSDMRIHVTSTKALSNLDTDDTTKHCYKSKIYPLYPRSRKKRRPEVDIVFVHGILGGVFVTWRQKEKTEKKLTVNGKRINGKNGNNKINVVADTKNSNNDSTDTKDILTDGEDIVEMAKKKHAIFNNPVAQDLLEKAFHENELESDWEVVYNDCPEVSNKDESKGTFSVSGDDWLNEGDSDEFTNCWPMDWLPYDFPNIRVIGLNYASTLSQWYSKYYGCGCPITRGTIATRANEFLDSLASAGVGQNRPVIWVGHSMGGLIVKSIITQSLESSDENVRKIGENTKAIMFLGTPHKGTPVAKLKQHMQMILSPTIEVREMVENASSLLKLNDKFLNYISKLKEPIELVSIAEGIPTVITSFKLSYHVVTEESANIERGDFYKLHEDHLGISKPIYKQSFLYQRLLGIITKTLMDFKAKTSPKNDEEDDLLRNLISFMHIIRV